MTSQTVSLQKVRTCWLYPEGCRSSIKLWFHSTFFLFLECSCLFIVVKASFDSSVLWNSLRCSIFFEKNSILSRNKTAELSHIQAAIVIPVSCVVAKVGAPCTESVVLILPVMGMSPDPDMSTLPFNFLSLSFWSCPIHYRLKAQKVIFKKVSQSWKKKTHIKKNLCGFLWLTSKQPFIIFPFIPWSSRGQTRMKAGRRNWASLSATDVPL